MDIHVDPLGGWSGDMFVAAMLDAFPEHWPAVQTAIAGLDLGAGAAISLVDHRDHALTGRRFLVAAEDRAPEEPHRHSAHEPHHHHGAHVHDHHDETHEHGHRAWADIRAMITGSHLDGPVKDRAVAIFRLLAEAEAQVHGVDEEAVAFHEVGAVDSIVDIVAASCLITAAGTGRWTSAPLPLGSGRVRTQHGILPVPAPATALLLRGLPTIDDGIAGERVTPTGAAIARHLLSDAPQAREPRRLTRSGTGFGTRTIPGLSNCLRVLAFDPGRETNPKAAFGHRELGVITFEVDDLSAEDLASGLDHIRTMPGVHDVVQGVVFGKKGRLATQVQVLAAPEALDAAIAGCFAQTTTIGLRYHLVRGAVLERRFDQVSVEGRTLRVKTVLRPDGRWTAKTEASDVAHEPGHADRVGLRREGEREALDRLRPGDGNREEPT